MAMPLIDPLPPAPTPADPEPVFDDKAYETVAALAPFVEQANALAVAVEGQAERSKTEADRSQALVSAATVEANRAKTEADRSKGEANRAQLAADNAVAVTTGGTASIDPAPGKIPIAGADAAIKQAWVKDLEFELDALRVARNKLMYGDGPYPVLDLQFQGAKRLDPRIAFTRASLDWDEEGNEYGINEPVLTDEGLWNSGSRTNLIKENKSFVSLVSTPVNWGISVSEPAFMPHYGVARVFVGDGEGEARMSASNGVNFEEGKIYTLSFYVKAETAKLIQPRLFSSVFGENQLAEFDIKEGVVISASGGASGRITRCKDGWFRVQLTTAPAVISSPSRFDFTALSARRGEDYRGSFRVFAPQIEEGRRASPAIPTEGSQVTVARTSLGPISDSRLAQSLRTFSVEYSDWSTWVDSFLIGVSNSSLEHRLMFYSQHTSNLEYGTQRLVFSQGGDQNQISRGSKDANNFPAKVAFTYSPETGDVGIATSWRQTSFSVSDVLVGLNRKVDLIRLPSKTQGFVKYIQAYSSFFNEDELQGLIT